MDETPSLPKLTDHFFNFGAHFLRWRRRWWRRRRWRRHREFTRRAAGSIVSCQAPSRPMRSPHSQCKVNKVALFCAAVTGLATLGEKLLQLWDAKFFQRLKRDGDRRIPVVSRSAANQKSATQNKAKAGHA